MKPATAPTKAIHSMTGFAQARLERDGRAVRINLRSVNHRFLDIHLRMPDGFEVFEARIRQALRNRLRRGHVDVNVYYEQTAPSTIEVNQEVAGAYMKAVEALRREFDVRTEPDLIGLFRLPGVVAAPGTAGELQSEQAQEKLGEQVDACLEQALVRLETMRRSEGQALAREMHEILARISSRATEIEKLAEDVRPAIARRLAQRLEDLLKTVQIDPARLAQEAALLTERGDVSEELARLHSHVEQFQKLLATAGETGKKLDFLLQEMQREANTLLSKTPGVESEGLAITGLALEVKSDIEKLREQAQNVE
ncbi:MAG TPA: YicC/YloC family endoribonuclease [Candidatus Dormibacteraeota bacterium]|nr:YicC/YloC family endoribonuclease [Candidatus Dormibacteraeota bacterium]